MQDESRDERPPTRSETAALESYECPAPRRAFGAPHPAGAGFLDQPPATPDPISLGL